MDVQKQATPEPPFVSVLPLDAFVGGRYRIDRILGWGAHGVVYKSWDAQTNRDAVIKVSRSRSKVDLDRLRNEATYLRRLSHPNIASFIDSGPLDDGGVFVATAFVAGDSVHDLIQSGPLTFDAALEISRAVASALATVHDAGLLHRDVKPGNVIVPFNGTTPAYRDAVLIDFGIALELDRSGFRGGRRTRANVRSGTALFMAPEQSCGWPQTEATDLFGLGALLVMMLTRHAPHAPDNLVTRFSFPEFAEMLQVEVVPNRLSRDFDWPETATVPAAIKGVVTRLLRRDPTLRERDARRAWSELGAVGER